MAKNEIITVNTQYLPELKKDEVKEVYKISKSTLPNLGLAASCNEKGFYKCVFPNGVSGALAKAKDGSGNLGTIIDKNGIAGQARFIEQTMDPTMMFVAAALHNIEEKLDDIIEITKEMFEFQQIQEKSELYSDIQFLNQTLRDYQSNLSNQLWLNSKITVVVECQKNAMKEIELYKNLAKNAAEDSGLMDKLVHTDDKASEKIDKVIEYFKNYQEAVFSFAFAEYVHILVTESYDELYLQNIQDDINRLSTEYRNIFSKVSEQLEKYSRQALDLKTIELVGGAVKAIGDLASKNKLGQKMQNAGQNMKKYTKESIEEKIKKLSNYQKAPVYQFAESIKAIEDVYHKPLELYYDDNNYYFVDAEKQEEIYA